jgi:hypothetical protein
LCPRAILLVGGQIATQGPTGEVIANYQQTAALRAQNLRIADRQDRSGSGSVRVTDLVIRNAIDHGGVLTPESPAEILVSYRSAADRPLGRLYVGVEIRDSQDNGAFGLSTAMRNADFLGAPPAGVVCCRLPALSLIPGQYSIGVKLLDQEGRADSVSQALYFDVEQGSGVYWSRSAGSVVMPHEWELQNSPAPQAPTDAAR